MDCVTVRNLLFLLSLIRSFINLLRVNVKTIVEGFVVSRVRRHMSLYVVEYYKDVNDKYKLPLIYVWRKGNRGEWGWVGMTRKFVSSKYVSPN